MSPSSGYTSPSSYGSSSPGYGLAGAGEGYAAGKASSSPALREQRRKATDTLEQMKAALIGFATAKVKEFMTEALPGFNQHLDEAERRHQEFHQPGREQQAQQSPGYGQGMSDQPRSEYGSGLGIWRRASSLAAHIERDRQEPRRRARLVRSNPRTRPTGRIL